jgi:hypothetical protein
VKLHTINDGDLILVCGTVSSGNIFSVSEDGGSGFLRKVDRAYKVHDVPHQTSQSANVGTSSNADYKIFTRCKSPARD